MSTSLTFIPLSQLRESPFNPRKAYPEAELLELADSIRSQGVLQPVVVRPLPDSQGDIKHTHELVFGHRRARAAALAQLDAVPCIVRAFSDREAAVAQAHENAKRADVTPFEEADSFLHLMAQHSLSAEQVAEAVGKSRSYVYGRLKLCKASTAVRAAFADEGLSAEIALEVARIPSAKAQGAALNAVRHYSGGWLSTRDAKLVLKQRFVVDLKEAPWDLADATLAPGAGACSSCPHMSLNDPSCATGLDTLCLDKACYETKEQAHRQRHLAYMAAAGHTVVTGDAAKALLTRGEYSAPEGYSLARQAGVYQSGQYIGFKHQLERAAAQGIEPPKRTLVQLQPNADPVELIAEQDLLAFQHQLGLRDADDDSDTEQPDPLAHWSPTERLTRDPALWRSACMAALRGVRGRPRTLAELRLVMHALVDCRGEFGEAGVQLGVHGTEVDEAALHSWIETATADQLAELLVADALDQLLSGYCPNQADAARRIALAEHYGVDLLALAQPPAPPAEAASTPSPAARAPEGATPAPPAAPAAGQAKPRPNVRYVDTATGMSWSGKGLQPAWVKAALAAGRKLADFEAQPQPQKQMDNAGGAAAVGHAEAAS